jgi:hypothetical protein
VSAVVPLSLSWLLLGSYRSSSWTFFFFPQTLQAVYAKPASRSAPPTPPTTPPMVALAVLLRPELPPLFPLPVNEAGSTLVVTGTALLLVCVATTTLPPFVLVSVMTTSEYELLVIKVSDAEDDVSEVSLVSEAEELVCRVVLLGVRVDVVVIVVVDDVPGNVMVEEVVMTDSDAVGEVVVDDDVSLSVAESVGEVLEESLVTPVFNGTLWRLKRAMASSSGSAVTMTALSRPSRRKTNDRMVPRSRGPEESL